MLEIVALLLAFAALGNGDVDSGEAHYGKPPNHGGIYVVAHRGAHKEAPENTLAAYQKAIDLGADFVEIDLQVTKDGKLVSIHNRTVDAYTNDGTVGEVADFTLAELKALDIGSRVGPRWKNERIATFDEILGLCKDKIGIYLDLKAAPVELATDRIKVHGMEKQVIWCVSPGEVKSIRQFCPACIPMPDPESEATLPAMLERTRPRIVAPVWRDFSSTFSAICHKSGAIVIVDEDEPTAGNWSLALEWGADGIQSDDPGGLIEFLKHREVARNVVERDR